MTETAALAKEQGIKLPAIEQRWCDACIRSKMHRGPIHKVLRETDHLKPFELVYAGVAGPMPVRSTHNGYRMVLGFICAKTNTSRIYPLHNLNQIQDRTEEFLNWVRHQKVTNATDPVKLVGVRVLDLHRRRQAPACGAAQQRKRDATC